MLTSLADSLALVTHPSYSLILLRSSLTFYSYSAEHSTLFFSLLSLTKQISCWVYKTSYMYLVLTLDLCNPCVVLSLSWVTNFQGLIHLCSLSPGAYQALDHPCCTRAHQALDYLCHTRAHQAPDYFYKSTSYFEGLFACFPQPTMTLV